MKTEKYHLGSTFSSAGEPFYFWFDVVIIAASFFILPVDFLELLNPKTLAVLLIIVSLAGFLPVLVSALRALLKRKLTIDLLAGIALIFSLLAQEWRSAVFISLMLASARLFASYAGTRASRAIESLIKLRPTKVHVLIDDKVVETDFDKVKVGDLVVVESGERIAVDGIVISGEASIDQSSLTGESEPLTKTINDEVLSSTLNIGGSLVISAKRVGDETTFSKILDLVTKSQTSKAPITSIVDRFAGGYILVTLIGSIILYVLTRDLPLVLSVLLVTCADDLAVAVPLALTAAIGVAARWGIIIKGGEFLEGLTKIKTVIFDKTGTITEGKPKVEEVKVFEGIDENKFLQLLGAAESESSHPAAEAIKKFIESRNIGVLKILKVHEEPGFGIRGKIDGQEILAGKTKFLKDNGVIFSSAQLAAIEEQKIKHRTVTVLGQGARAVGFVAMSDVVRPAALPVMEQLKSMGVERLVMLTGDNEKIASEVASRVGIDEFLANMLPQEKLDYIKKTLKSKEKVAMVGDGVNDAAALALADVGIAMGAIGSDAAIESADIVLMKDNLFNIPQIINLSHYTLKIIVQNLWFWGALNLLGLGLVFGGVLDPGGAAAYNFVTDFLPLINSFRVFRFRRQKQLT